MSLGNLKSISIEIHETDSPECGSLQWLIIKTSLFEKQKYSRVLDTAEMVISMAENNKSPTKQIPCIWVYASMWPRRGTSTEEPYLISISFRVAAIGIHQNLIMPMLHAPSSGLLENGQNPSNPNPKSVTEATPVESDDSILRVNNCWSET